MSFWVKGNIHTHTTESDGDADPKSVMKWYKDHEYDFLVITDHNHRTIIDFDNNNPQSEKELVLIPGEEVTAHVLEDFAKNILNYGVDGKIPIHINGIDIKKVVEPIHTKDIVTTLQANIDAIKNAGGLVSLNHPNYKWAFDHTQISKLKNVDLLEIFNGHPAVNVYGAVGKYSCEQIWDNVLSNGQKIFGVATDDSHHYHDFAYNKSNPGRGWIVAKVKELAKNNIVSAIKSGDFYASTGIEMENIIINNNVMELEIKPEIGWTHNSNMQYRIDFITQNGQVIKQINDIKAKCNLENHSGYVRATISSSSGPKAWIQPVYI